VEDIAQEIFLKAFMHLSSFDGRGSLEGWLSKISTTVCLNEIRHSKSRPEIALGTLTDGESNWLDARLTQLNSSDGNNTSAEQSILASDLAEKVLRTLSPEDRLILILLDGEELSVREVSEATGWSETNVKVRAFRARRRMHRALDKLMRRKTRPGGGTVMVQHEEDI
jgi:RNA polymerase sigma-70 factor (ECF subfamily)